jgi:hypothetical protein
MAAILGIGRVGAVGCGLGAGRIIIIALRFSKTD